MMFPFGKPVAEPRSDAIQASHSALRLLDRSPLYPLVRATFLRLCPCNRTRVGASSLGIFQRARRAFPDRYRRKHLVCVRDCAFRRMSTTHVR